MKRVEQVLDSYVRPMLRADGGDLELVDIKERVVYVRLAGACSTCIGATQTLKLLVERSLKEQVDERARVIAL
jgi:Fe-S cluster biogenesis protein NfuA